MFAVLQIALAAQATERAMGGTEYFEQRALDVGLYPPESPPESPPPPETPTKLTVSRAGSKKKRDKSPRPSPLPTRRSPRTGGVKAIASGLYKGSETRSIYRGSDEFFDFEQPVKTDAAEVIDETHADELSSLYGHLK